MVVGLRREVSHGTSNNSGKFGILHKYVSFVHRGAGILRPSTTYHAHKRKFVYKTPDDIHLLRKIARPYFSYSCDAPAPSTTRILHLLLLLHGRSLCESHLRFMASKSCSSGRSQSTRPKPGSDGTIEDSRSEDVDMTILLSGSKARVTTKAL